MPDQHTPDRRRPDPVARFLFALISLTVVALGVLAVVTEFAPARSTRFGMAGPLFDGDAVHFGVTMIFVGLAPLGFFARTARGAGWWAGGCMALALLTLFVGLRLVP
jgi:hypothetical protein